MARLATRIEGPVAVIGDVHGQVEQLLAVLEQLRDRRDYEQRWIVFIGDLVDRGPDSKAVMDLVCDLLVEHARTTVVSGNHELAMAGALELIPTPEYAEWSQRWLDDYGAQSTFASYDVEFGDLVALRSQLDERHVALLSDLPWVVEHPQYLFVHAGLDPNIPFAMQLKILQRRDYTLNRPQWLCSKGLVSSATPADCPQAVVSGHVQVPSVKITPKRLLIDTTGGMGGDLSCVLLPENRVISSGGETAPETVGAEPSGKSWWKLW